MTDELTPEAATATSTDMPDSPADHAELLAVRAWLAAEALKIRHRLPHMRVPEAWQAMDGMAHGLEYAARIIDQFAATGRLPVTGGAECDCANPETQHRARAADPVRDDELARLRADLAAERRRNLVAKSRAADTVAALAQLRTERTQLVVELAQTRADRDWWKNESVRSGELVTEAQRVRDEARAQVAAVREYVATSDDDGIRTRQRVLAITGELPDEALDAAPTPEAGA